MFLIAAQLTALGIAIFILALSAFIIAVRFFVDSKKNFDQFLSGQKKLLKKTDDNFFDNIIFFKRRPEKIKLKPAPYRDERLEIGDAATDEIKDLRTMLLKQQNQLSKALTQISGLENEFQEKPDDATSAKKIRELETLSEKKDSEIKKLKQQVDVSKRMQSYFDEMQKDFDVLQGKLQKLEKQAWEANELTMKLDNITQSHQYLQKDVLKKEEKIRDLATENQRLHSVLSETEDKLQESNLQRQQLTKKMQFLEEMNNDMKQVSDTNRKLQNELRRIAELESMLNLITEERDELLKKRRK